MQRTANLDLPYILPNQAQKHVTHNEAIRALDAIVQLAVIDRDRTAAPEAPQEGDRYIVAANAQGLFAGQKGSIAAWQDGAWMFHTPRVVWLAWVIAEQTLLAFDGEAWQFAGGRNALLEYLSVNGAVTDDHNRLAVQAGGSLFNHDGDNHRLAINRNTAVDTASILFQTGFSGNAEIGLAGDGSWRLKLSGDGVSWTTVLAAHPGGTTEFGGPLRLVTCNRLELPDPVVTGPGAMIHFLDEAGNGEPAYCDGARWRRVADGAVISLSGDG